MQLERRSPANGPTSSPKAPDNLREIAAAAKAGDPNATRALIRKTRATTRRLVCKVLGSAHPDIDDVVQEAALALVDSIKTFRGESSVRHYANSITLRVALAARRRYHSARRWLTTTAPGEGLTWATLETPLTVAMSNRDSEVVRRILGEMSPLPASVLVLHVISGYTAAEVASEHGMTEGTVRSQLKIGKKQFRRLLRRELRTGRLA